MELTQAKLVVQLLQLDIENITLQCWLAKHWRPRYLGFRMHVLILRCLARVFSASPAILCRSTSSLFHLSSIFFRSSSVCSFPLLLLLCLDCPFERDRLASLRLTASCVKYVPAPHVCLTVNVFHSAHYGQWALALMGEILPNF